MSRAHPLTALITYARNADDRYSLPAEHVDAVRRVAHGFVVSATAPDGTVEALEMPGHPWLLAVQWHPELTAATDPAQQRLFDALVDTVRSG